MGQCKGNHRLGNGMVLSGEGGEMSCVLSKVHGELENVSVRTVGS
jgi:hypothetical protein